MGIYVIRTPDIGEGIAEVELVNWLVQPGDVVAESQHLADVMTDKATVEVPSPVAGTVLALGCGVGQVVAVGAELVRLEVEGEGNLKENSAPAPVHKEVKATVSVAKEAPAATPAPAPRPAPASAPAPATARSSAAARSSTTWPRWRRPARWTSPGCWPATARRSPTTAR